MVPFRECVVILLFVSVYGMSRPPLIDTNPAKNIYYKPGETVQMLCDAIGEPRPEFYWQKDESDFNPSGNDDRIVQLANVGTLVINNPQGKDEGFYQCFAKNEYGISTSVKVNLREARLREFNKMKDTIHTPKLGIHYTLPCVPPESIPKAQVFWIIRSTLGGFEAVNYDARVTMDREYRLRFTNIKTEDEQGGQPYACMALNNIMRSSSQGPQHFIKVTGNAAGYQPVSNFWSDQDDRFGLKGDLFSLKCIFAGNPTPDVHWERTDNGTMSSRVKLMSFAQELQFEDLQFEDAGKYECWANNIASGASRLTRVFNVRVQSVPFFTQAPVSVETGVGANVQFHCYAEGNPEPRLDWYINGDKLKDVTDPRITGKRFKRASENTIQMVDVVETDYMTIQCNASNKHGYSFANAYLNVLLQKPEIIQPPQPRLVSAEGLVVSLTCRTYGKPDPIITWYKDGVQVTGGRYQILINGDLHINAVVLADAGHYICEAKNIFNTTSRGGSLIVRRKTRIEQKPGDLERNAGMDAKFTCSGTTDPEEVDSLRILWLKDGKESTMNDQRMMTNFQDNSLTISGTLTRDSGTYTCVATNGLDRASASAVLTVRDKPDSPTKVRHEDCDKFAIIYWMPGSYNNAPVQYFILQYNTTFNPNQWNFGMKVNSTLSKVNMTLSPYVNYTFRVIAYNKIGPSDPSMHTPNFCTTKSALPTYHPRNLRTIGNEAGNLYIEWTPVPPLHHNGPGFVYTLSILRIGDSPETANKPETIDDWKTNHFIQSTGNVYARYQISIKSSNNVGDATGAPPSIIGHSFESTPMVTPTNFEVVDDNVGETYAYFKWDFDKTQIDKVGTKIQGQFMGFKIQFWQNNFKALTIREFDVGPESVLNTTGNTFYARVHHMLPNTDMLARISVMNNFYVGRPTEAIRFHTTPGFPGPVEYVRVRKIGDTHVYLDWGSPLENRGDLLGYDISYQLVNGLDLGEMQEREPQINDRYTTSAYLSGLQPKKKYRVHVYARTQAGRGEGYFIEIVTTKPGIPLTPRFSVVSVGEHHINISWFVNAELSSGSVVFAEYRKLDGAEWLRTTDEVIHTWKNISNLEPGTTYELRIKATNGAISIPSGIEEIKTKGTAIGSALIGNIGWFLGMLFSILLLIALIVLFLICYKRGFTLGHDRSSDYVNNSSAAYSGSYDNTARMDKGSEHFGPEPQGYNNDYYNDKDYNDEDNRYDDGGFEDKYRPPSYSSEMDRRDAYGSDNVPPPAGDYEDYERKPSRSHDDNKEPSKFDKNGAPVDDRSQRDNDYHDDNYYDRRNDDYYDRRDDNYDRRDDDSYDRRDGVQYDTHADNTKGYDYDSDEPSRRPPSKHGGQGNGHSSTVV